MRTRYIGLFAFLLLSLLTGCSGTARSTELSSVENRFMVAQHSLPPATPIGTGTSVCIDNAVATDALGPYLTYDGDEMRLRLRIQIGDLDDQDFGIHLYVDGQPQPYHTDTNGTFQYMHTFPTRNGKEFTLELCFTPVTGQAGDTLEIGFAFIAYPDYFPNGQWDGTTMTDWNCMGLTVRMHYLTDPPASAPPGIPDRMKYLCLEYTDLPAAEAELFASGTYQKEVQYALWANQKKDFGILYALGPENPLELEFELKGSSLADFGLVLYLDHQPVSVSAEDRIYVCARNGQKVTVRAQVDLSGFDGESVFYSVLVPRNLRRQDLGGSCLLTILGPYYLSAAEPPQRSTSINS